MRNEKRYHGFATTHSATACLICLVSVWLLSSTACVHTVPTISFDEFLALQNELTPPEPGPAPTDPETGKARVDTSLGPYQVGPEDVLMVTLSGLDVAVVSPVSARVHSDGTVRLPLAGEVRVEGKTLEEARALVAAM